mmetsp:Transcript_26981/g.37540  ORF Transcript_26981/g.37540 Transcript_26981/m.37540 type:complete len:273 (-) Transcript_26981:117-935(-)|eukprot:CAMPEP_0184489574 /NCGR_PEP_ID=MMETSP0113_2-20130426/15823_1 /TAXON_ID=91329 /ORGANISM="Norrisiella sphaerica, Strain BC52" /LENGTH=272 /DNA_ID=CAMNT_0026873077 /DNA_START=100 /DNA_END=918 /DNA_ORIENTATION=-
MEADRRPDTPPHRPRQHSGLKRGAEVVSDVKECPCKRRVSLSRTPVHLGEEVGAGVETGVEALNRGGEGKSPPMLRPFLSQRWSLSRFSGSFREGGGVNPLAMAKCIRGRISQVLSKIAEDTMGGDKHAGELLAKFMGLKVESVKASCAKLTKAGWQAAKVEYFRTYMEELHQQAQRFYDADPHYKIKWINCLPTFQTRFGVSACRIEPFVMRMENVDLLRSLYVYFFMLYLDAHCVAKNRATWAKLFPRKNKYVIENGIDLRTFDTYEDMI